MFKIYKSLNLKMRSLQSLIVFSICLYYFVSGASTPAAPEIFPILKTTLAITAFMLFSIFFARRHVDILKSISSGSSIVILALWIVLIAIVQLPSLIFVLILVLTFYDKNLMKMAGYLFTWLSFIFILFATLASFGVIDPGEALKSNLLVDVDDFKSITALGMGNPNMAMAYVLGIIMAGSFIFYNTKYRVRYGLIMVAVSLLVYSLVGSRTGLIAALLFLALYIIDLRRLGSLLRFSILPLMIGLLVLSVYIGYKYGTGDNVVNNFLTTRPYNWNLRLENGALGNLIGNSDTYVTIDSGNAADRYPLDNQYIYMLARFGWIPLLLVFTLYTIGSRRRIPAIVVYMLIVSIVQAFVESLMFMAIANIGLLFMLSELIIKNPKERNIYE